MSKSTVLVFNGGSVGEGGSCNVHNLQLGIMSVNVSDTSTASMYVLVDKSSPIESEPHHAPVDRYELYKWIRRGDVVQIDCYNLVPTVTSSYSGILQDTEDTTDSQSKIFTSACTIRLDIDADNQIESRFYSLETVQDAITGIWYLACQVNVYTSVLNENAENKVQVLDSSDSHYPSCQAVNNAISSAIGSTSKIHYLKAVADTHADEAAPYGYWIIDLDKPNSQSPYGYDYALASDVTTKLSNGDIFVLSTYSEAPSSDEDLFFMNRSHNQSNPSHTAVRIDFVNVYSYTPNQYMRYTSIYTPSRYNNGSDEYPEGRLAILNPSTVQTPFSSFEFMPHVDLANVATTGSYTDLNNKPDLALKEDVANKAQTLDATSTTDYPSSKAAGDFIASSIANIKTTTIRQTGQADDSKCPTEAAVRTAIDSAVSSAYHAAGTKTVAQLTGSLLVYANEGDVYNITDSGSTTSDFIEGAGHPISAGDNVVVCDVGGGVYKFDLLSGFIDLTNYLTKTDDGSNVTASFTTASTRTNVSTGEKLSVLFGKVAKWFSDLKALAFKDKVSTADIDDDAVTADKVKDNETLPANVTGYASHLRQATCRFINSETGYRLMAYLPPKSGYSDTLYIFNIYEARDGALLDSGILKGTLSISIRNNNGTYQYSSTYKGNSINNIGFNLRVDSSTHGVFVYAAKSNQYYCAAVFELLNAFDGYGTDVQGVLLYADSALQSSVSGDDVTTVFTLLKQSGGMVPLAHNNGVGSGLEPVYVSSTGEVLKCENRIHDLTLQRKIIRINGQMTGRFMLCDRQDWTGTPDSPIFMPVDPYALATWINRGDVIQVDFTTYDWWGDKYPGLIVEAQCSTLSGESYPICTNLRVLRQKIVNQQPTLDFQWGDLIEDEDTNIWYMEFQSVT